MIISKNGTSYETSDGSEQPHEASAERVQRSEREQINRWEDDGPGPHSRAAPAPPAKPSWSVLSLRGLLAAVRALGERPAVALQEERERARGEEWSAEQDRLGRDTAVDAEKNRYRNAWENT